MATETSTGDKRAPATEEPAQAKLRGNTQNLKSSYENFCNATSTREEVVPKFGVSDNWRTSQDMAIELAHRIVLSPFAAKRLSRSSAS